MLELEPQVLLHGHHRRQLIGADGKPAQGRGDTPVTRQDLLDFKASAQRLAGGLASLVKDRAEEKCRADWVRFEPYRVQLACGESTTVDVVIENLDCKPIDVTVRLVLPPGPTADPATIGCRVAPGEQHHWSCKSHLAELDRPCSSILCVDVTRNGQPLGWVAECQLWHAETAG